MLSQSLPKSSESVQADYESLEASFRLAMRRLASGVAIVTTAHGGRRFGMTATAVTSLCMAPTAMTVCINRSASMYSALFARKAFCINLLTSEDAEFCRQFSAAPSHERFNHGVWEGGENELPRLVGSQASIICSLGPQLSFGTHTVLVGEVVSVHVEDKVDPLIYLDGNYVTVGRAA